MSGPADKGFGAHPFGEIARATVAAQERSLELAQAWSGSLQQLVSDQAEGGRAALEALTSTLAATERALASQEEANKALRQSLEANRGGARGLREHGPGPERRLPAAARGGPRGPAEAARAGVNHPSWVMPGGLGPGIVDT
ncbi:MAG TPA: hypothetical protein VG409_02175 [Actinomycetota bacterium]|nr:hypothetical protein [Actinomycetota bacterium]